MNQNYSAVLTLLCLLFTISLSGCATQLTNNQPLPSSHANANQSILFGTIVTIHPVKIYETNTNDAEAKGATKKVEKNTHIIVDHHSNNALTLATIASLLGGTVLGHADENKINFSEGLEMTIKIQDSGKLITTVQPLILKDTFKIGEKVKILIHGDRNQVSKL